MKNLVSQCVLVICSNMKGEYEDGLQCKIKKDEN